MSKALDFIRKHYNDPRIQPIKEWSNNQGEIGVYQLVIKDELGRGLWVYNYTLILLNTEEFRVVEATSDVLSLTSTLKNAEMIAKFANAKEQQS